MKQRMLGTICALAIALTSALAGSPSSAAPYYELKDAYYITSPTIIGHTVTMIDPTGQTITKDKCTSEPGDYTQATFRVQGTNSICDLTQIISDDAVSERLKIDGSEFTFTSMTAVLIDKAFEGMSFKEVSVVVPKGWAAKTADFDGDINEEQTVVTWTHVTRNVTAKGSTKAAASATSEATPSSSSSPSSTVSSSSNNNWIFLHSYRHWRWHRNFLGAARSEETPLRGYACARHIPRSLHPATHATTGAIPPGRSILPRTGPSFPAAMAGSASTTARTVQPAATPVAAARAEATTTAVPAAARPIPAGLTPTRTFSNHSAFCNLNDTQFVSRDDCAYSFVCLSSYIEKEHS